MAGCRTDVARRICVPIPARLDSSRLQPRGHNSTWDMLLRTTRNRIHGCHVCDCRLPVPKHLHLRLRRKCQPAYLAGRKAPETPARVLRRKEPVRLDCHHHGRLYGTGTHFFACRTATHCVSAQHSVDYDRHSTTGHLHSLCFGWSPFPWPSSYSPKENCTSRTERTT